MNKNAMKLAIWMKRFKEREELKLTVEEYCERIGEPRKKYYYWHKKAVDLAFTQQESNLQPAPIINNPVSNVSVNRTATCWRLPKTISWREAKEKDYGKRYSYS